MLPPRGPQHRREFKGLGKLAGPLASRDIKKRWEISLEALKATAEEQ
jgi:phage FluMu protein gp41